MFNFYSLLSGQQAVLGGIVWLLFETNLTLPGSNLSDRSSKYHPARKRKKQKTTLTDNHLPEEISSIPVFARIDCQWSYISRLFSFRKNIKNRDVTITPLFFHYKDFEIFLFHI